MVEKVYVTYNQVRSFEVQCYTCDQTPHARTRVRCLCVTTIFTTRGWYRAMLLLWKAILET